MARVVIYSDAHKSKIIATGEGKSICDANATLYKVPMKSDYYYSCEIQKPQGWRPFKFVQAPFAFASTCKGDCHLTQGDCFEHPDFAAVHAAFRQGNPQVQHDYSLAKYAAMIWGCENVDAENGVKYVAV